MSIRKFIALSGLSYLVSFIAIVQTGPELSLRLNQLFLAISYLPFLVVLAWAVFLGMAYFASNLPSPKQALIAFGINAVVFVGWLSVLLVHFSIFRPHV
ncbi:hypothetical protein [Simiduia aestuariiviva]|uniref:Uncharacterized protein n=1 Tax=Simiduia aestuariiviva TaxID=1510459 RepID=A0A839UJE4_9GAMM|nr:hypothetical protein [Simiduia aestuariiviva]MBB3166891.1 hypothetical protein [Simiduia aestuariiviva]